MLHENPGANSADTTLNSGHVRNRRALSAVLPNPAGFNLDYQRQVWCLRNHRATLFGTRRRQMPRSKQRGSVVPHPSNANQRRILVNLCVNARGILT